MVLSDRRMGRAIAVDLGSLQAVLQSAFMRVGLGIRTRSAAGSDTRCEPLAICASRSITMPVGTRTRERLALRSAALLMVSLSVIGCGRNGPTRRGLIAVRQPNPPNSGSAEAQLQGTLTYADGCTFLVATGNGPVRLLWPSGFTARNSGSKLEVLDANGTVAARVNSSVTVGGGFVSEQDATLSVKDNPNCATRPSFWVDTIRTP